MISLAAIGFSRTNGSSGTIQVPVCSTMLRYMVTVVYRPHRMRKSMIECYVNGARVSSGSRIIIPATQLCLQDCRAVQSHLDVRPFSQVLHWRNSRGSAESVVSWRCKPSVRMPKVSYTIEQLGALYLFGEALKPVAIQGLHHLGSGYRFDLKSSSLVPTTLQE